MKKLLLFGVTALLTGVIIVSSCKKSSNQVFSNWICQCSLTNSSGSYQTLHNELNMTEGDATTACAQWQVASTSTTTTAACQLKQQ